MLLRTMRLTSRRINTKFQSRFNLALNHSRKQIVGNVSIATTAAISSVLILNNNMPPKERFILNQVNTKDFEPTWKPKEPATDLDQIGGSIEIMNGLTEIVTYLQDPKKYIDSGLKAPRGVILSGPPGVGKTMIAEAIAGQAGVPLIVISAPEVESIFVGGTEANLRQLFETARKNAPCVLCIDEFDAIASKRFTDITGHNQHYINSKIDQLLSLLSQDNKGVVVIGTTNHFESLDPAVIRPGRFDKHIYIPLPNVTDREKILALHTKNKSLNSSVSMKQLAQLSVGFSGAKIAAWVNQAAYLAVEDKSAAIDKLHFDKALSILENGVSDSVQTNLNHKVNTAKHEVGHALVGHLLGLNLYKVSIKRSGKSFGATTFLPDNEESNSTKKEVLDKICVMMAGRAAEQLYGEEQTGSSYDLNKARELAQMLVKDEGFGSTLSGVTAISDVEHLLDSQKQRALKILTENKNTFNILTEALLENQELYKEQVADIFSGKSIPKKTTTGFFSNLFYGSASKVDEKQPQRKIPEKKPYVKRIGVNSIYFDSKNASSGISSTEKQFPFTIDEVAKAINVNSTSIREIREYIGGWQIRMKPSFNKHDVMEEISKTLKANDVENIYLSGSHSSGGELNIYSQGVKDFYEFVKKHNDPNNNSSNQDNKNSWSFSSWW